MGTRLLQILLSLLPPSAVALAIGFLPEASRIRATGSLLYWSTAFLLCAAAGGAFACRRYLRAAFRWRREWGWGAVLAAALALLCFGLVPPRMRVQWDETHLVSTAKTMRALRTAEAMVEAVWVRGEIVPVQLALDKRPPLFPFLTSLLLEAGVPAPEAAFLLNGILFFLLLLLVYCHALPAFGAWGAAASVFLLASVPVVLLCAASAGFDLLSFLLLLAVLSGSLRFLSDPRRESFAFFFLLGILFSYSRYECALLFLPLLAALLAARPQCLRDSLVLGLLGALPLLFCPLVLLGLHAYSSYLPQDEALSGGVFSLGNGWRHLQALSRELLNPRPGRPFPGALNLAGLAGLGAAAWKTRRFRREWLLPAGAVASLTALSLFWWYGDPGEPASFRLFLPIAGAGALLPLAWLRVVRHRLFPAVFLAGAVLAFALEIGQVRRHGVGRVLWVSKVTEEIDDLLVSQGAGRPLFVSSVSEYFVLKGHAAIDPETLERKRGLVAAQLRSGELGKVILVEIPPAGKPAVFPPPAPGDGKEVLWQKQLVRATLWRPGS